MKKRKKFSKRRRKAYEALERAVYGWFFKCTDSYGDDSVKLSMYQSRMMNALKILRKLDE